MFPKMIGDWFTSLFKVWRREFRMVFGDAGVVLFFLFLPLVYPIVYTLIYNTEVPREIPVAVIDRSMTAESREFVRKMSATSAISVAAYATDLPEARRMLNGKDCYGILEIPADYSRRIGRREQAVVVFYSDMSLLLRYRTLLLALTDLQLALGDEVRTEITDLAGLPAQSMTSVPVASQGNFLGDPSQGFASFVMPGIVILILQQSLILGILMIAGGCAERRRANGGTDPLTVSAPATAQIIGKTLCYLTIYAPLTLYILHFIPIMFSLPHIGQMRDYLPLVLPLLLASSFLGLSLQIFVKERESSMPVFVATSVICLFLSGLTWPVFALNDFWRWLSDCIPASWAVRGFIRINNNGATLADNSGNYTALWILSAVYFLTAWLYLRFTLRAKKKICCKT